MRKSRQIRPRRSKLFIADVYRRIRGKTKKSGGRRSKTKIIGLEHDPARYQGRLLRSRRAPRRSASASKGRGRDRQHYARTEMRTPRAARSALARRRDQRELERIAAGPTKTGKHGFQNIVIWARSAQAVAKAGKKAIACTVSGPRQKREMENQREGAKRYTQRLIADTCAPRGAHAAIGRTFQRTARRHAPARIVRHASSRPRRMGRRHRRRSRTAVRLRSEGGGSPFLIFRNHGKAGAVALRFFIPNLLVSVPGISRSTQRTAELLRGSAGQFPNGSVRTRNENIAYLSGPCGLFARKKHDVRLITQVSR